MLRIWSSWNKDCKGFLLADPVKSCWCAFFKWILNTTYWCYCSCYKIGLHSRKLYSMDAAWCDCLFSTVRNLSYKQSGDYTSVLDLEPYSLPIRAASAWYVILFLSGMFSFQHNHLPVSCIFFSPMRVCCMTNSFLCSIWLVMTFW